MARTEIADRVDQLQLLALIARGLGAKDFEGYEPASEAMRDAMNTPPEPQFGTAARERAVMQFLAQTGGD
jgi:hypothetical protein